MFNYACIGSMEFYFGIYIVELIKGEFQNMVFCDFISDYCIYGAVTLDWKELNIEVTPKEALPLVCIMVWNFKYSPIVSLNLSIS